MSMLWVVIGLDKLRSSEAAGYTDVYLELDIRFEM